MNIDELNNYKEDLFYRYTCKQIDDDEYLEELADIKKQIKQITINAKKSEDINKK